MYCTQCGKPHPSEAPCPATVRSRPSYPEPDSGPLPAVREETRLIRLPKAKTGRRLAGSGFEFLVYAIGATMIIPLSVLLLDIAITVPLFLMIALRDTHGGRFSLEKRLGRMRVVKYGTGLPIENRDALKRNGYYLVLIGATVLPFLPIDAFSSGLFHLAVVVDALMISLREDGRRMGDLLAGTQVVQEARRAAA